MNDLAFAESSGPNIDESAQRLVDALVAAEEQCGGSEVAVGVGMMVVIDFARSRFGDDIIGALAQLLHRTAQEPCGLPPKTPRDTLDGVGSSAH